MIDESSTQDLLSFPKILYNVTGRTSEKSLKQTSYRHAWEPTRDYISLLAKLAAKSVKNTVILFLKNILSKNWADFHCSAVFLLFPH